MFGDSLFPALPCAHMENQQSCSKNPPGKTAEQAGVSVEQASETTDMTLMKSDIS